MVKGLNIQAPTIERGPKYTVGQVAAPELPAQAGALSEQMQDIARSYLGARRQSGVSLLEAARWLSEARIAAKHGEWTIFLEAIGLDESRARAQIRIHEEAMRNPLFADRITNGLLSEAVARELLPMLPEAREELLARETPTTLADVREAKRASTPVLESREPKISELAPAIIVADERHRETIVSLLGQAQNAGERTGTALYQQAYGQARQVQDRALRDRLFAIIDRAVEGTPPAKDTTALAPESAAAPDFDAAHERARLLGYKLSTWGGWWRLASADDLHRDAAPPADVLAMIAQMEAQASAPAEAADRHPLITEWLDVRARWAALGYELTRKDDHYSVVPSDGRVGIGHMQWHAVVSRLEAQERKAIEAAVTMPDRVAVAVIEEPRTENRELRTENERSSAWHKQQQETDQKWLEDAEMAIASGAHAYARQLLDRVQVKTVARDALAEKIPASSPAPLDPRDEAIRLYVQLAPLLLQIKTEDLEALSMAIANLNECREGTEGAHLNGVIRAYLDLEED